MNSSPQVTLSIFVLSKKKLLLLLMGTLLIFLSFLQVKHISAQKKSTYSISGHVYVDNNKNGVQDKGDAPYKNAPLGIQRMDKLSKITTIRTDKNGFYSYAISNPGLYSVGFPNTKDVDLTTLQNFKTFLIGSDSSQVTINFGILKSPTVFLAQGDECTRGTDCTTATGGNQNGDVCCAAYAGDNWSYCQECNNGIVNSDGSCQRDLVPVGSCDQNTQVCDPGINQCVATGGGGGGGTTTCGDQGEACCQTRNKCNQVYLTCSSGTCVHCGQQGEPCCTTGALQCASGITCSNPGDPANGTCEAPAPDQVKVSFTPDPPPDGTVGQDYNGTGVLAIWTWSSQAGGGQGAFLGPDKTDVSILPTDNALPPGLSLQKTVGDFIDGTPAPGSARDQAYAFQVKSCNKDTGACDQKPASIHISTIGLTAPPTITNTAFACNVSGNPGAAPNSVTVTWSKGTPADKVVTQKLRYRSPSTGQTQWTEILVGLNDSSRTFAAAPGSSTFEFSVGNKANANTGGNSGNNDGWWWSDVKGTTVNCPTPPLTSTPTQKPTATPTLPGGGGGGASPTTTPGGGGGGGGIPTSTPIIPPGGGGGIPTSTSAPQPTIPCEDKICPTATLAPTQPPPQPTIPCGLPVCPTATPPPGGGGGQPSPTLTPAPIFIVMNLELPGIGKNVGDNPDPKRKERSVQVFLFDSSGKEVKRVSGTVDWGGTLYTGSVKVDNLPRGTYTAKVRLDNTLKGKLPDQAVVTFTLTNTGALNIKVPATITLLSGDLDGNDVIDLADYNILRSCYGGRLCAKKNISDLNEDSKVDEKDVNILLRGIALQGGDESGGQ